MNIPRVATLSKRACEGAATIGVRQHDFTDELFDIPVVHKHHGQLVDKRLVRRQSTLDTEVLFCFNNASAKELCPNSVDGNACRQWVIRADEPFCNAKAIEWCTCWKLSKGCWNSGLNGIPLHLEITECKHRAGALFVCCELDHDWDTNRSDSSTL